MRIVLLARHPVTLAGLRCLFESRDDFAVVGESTCTPDAVALVARDRPDIVVVDPDAEDISLNAVPALAEACDTTRVLVLTAATDPSAYTAAIELGASGVVGKEQPSDLLMRAIEKVHAGEMWLDRDKTARLLSRAVRRVRDPETVKIESLTNREREIVALVGEGLGNVPIAERLFISEATVRNHLTSILSKLKLANRFELAVYVFRHHLLPRYDAGAPGYRRPNEDAGVLVTTRRKTAAAVKAGRLAPAFAAAVEEAD